MATVASNKRDPDMPADACRPDGSQSHVRQGTTETTTATAPAGRPCGRILFLDDDPERARSFLDHHPTAVWVQTAEECIVRLAEPWDEVHLDHDLGGEIYVDSCRADCGMEVVRWLCIQPGPALPDTWFCVHSHNAEAAMSMVSRLRERGYQAVHRPFGVDIIEWLCLPSEPESDASAAEPPRPMGRLAFIPAWIRKALR